MKTTDLEPADSSLESLCALIGVGVCAMIGAPVVARMLRPSESAIGTDGISAAPVQTATGAPAALTPASAPMDWTPFLWLGGTAAVLVLAMFAWKRHSAHVCVRKKAQSALETDFAIAQNALSEVAAAYAEFLADPNDRYFARPSLDDIDDRHTAAFIDAFAAANELRPDTCPDSKERVLHFADAAHAARTAWEAADQNARTVGMGAEGRKRTQKVGRLRTALALIRNIGTGAEGRAADRVEVSGPDLRPKGSRAPNPRAT